MIQISNIKIRKDISDTKLFETIIKKYKIEPKDVVEWHISRKSIDARKKDDIHYIYSIDLKLKNENKGNILGQYIESLSGYPADSLEYQALCEGVQALMETRRG
mgnify:CR=1 FL=1